jgi:hypothetical protein
MLNLNYLLLVTDKTDQEDPPFLLNLEIYAKLSNSMRGAF